MRVPHLESITKSRVFALTHAAMERLTRSWYRIAAPVKHDFLPNRSRRASLFMVETRSQRNKVIHMHNELPVIYIARHGDTAWSASGQHTGLTDLPLTAEGEEHARSLRSRLKDIAFSRVFTSPLQRARTTCTLAGYGSEAEVDHDLVEWDYGKYEGLRSADILAERPDWDLFRDGAPGGETPAQVADRADSFWKRVRGMEGNVLVFSSGHFIRVLAARWIGLEPSPHCNSFVLGPAGLSAFGYDREISRPAIHLWNDRLHVSAA